MAFIFDYLKTFTLRRKKMEKNAKKIAIIVFWVVFLSFLLLGIHINDSFAEENKAVIAISAGDFSSLALRQDGTVLKWGQRIDGNKYMPCIIPNLTNVSSLSGGWLHDLFLKTDGTVWAWGSNRDGQLGDGTTQDSSVVKQVYGLTNIISVAAGCSHSMALKDDGTVWVWGLGPAACSYQNSSVPRQVYGLTDVVSIAAGDYHSLALKRDGTVWAWGQNNEGQLGDGTTFNRYEPVQVTGLSNVAAIAAGYGHSLALKNDGTVWAWGWNQDGQLGDGTTTSSLHPIQVRELTNAVAIAAGEKHSLALKNDGTVWAWGYNEYGQLGNGTTANQLAPVQVPGLSGVISIAAGIYHTLAFKSDGTVWAWGYNEMGQLGIGTGGIGVYSTYPVQSATILPTVSFGANSNIVAIESGSVTFTVYRTEGTLSTDLTVYYTVSGTATAGADYVVPSGSVTIPAGQTSVPIVVTLFDDSLPEGDETIILTLMDGPSYIVGLPSSAVLTIADNDNAGGGGSGINFWQGKGYQQGAYDLNAPQPTSYNWKRQSLFKGPDSPVKKWELKLNTDNSPVIGADGTVYIGGYNENWSEVNYYAINPDGTIKWVFPTPPRNIGDGFNLTSAVIGADGTIYFGSGANWDYGKLYALNPDGTLKWTFTTESRIDYPPAIGGDGTLYFLSRRYLYALYPDGSLKWSSSTGSPMYNSPAIGKDGTIYVGSTDHKLYAFNPDGAKKWDVQLNSYITESSPVISDDGTIYIGTASDKGVTGAVYAVNQDGSIKWSINVGDVYCTPSIGPDNIIYLPLDSGLTAIQPDGTKTWTFFQEGAFLNRSALVGKDGTIYVVSRTYTGINNFPINKLYALNPDGTKKWDLLIEPGGDACYPLPAIGTDGTMYVSLGNKLVAVCDNAFALPMVTITQRQILTHPSPEPTLARLPLPAPGI